MRRCVELGVADVTWGVFSLELAHHADGPAAGDPVAPGVRGLRTAIAVRDAHGNEAMGAFYAALGERYFDRLESYDDLDTFHGALTDIGLEPELYDRAVARKATFAALVKEHKALVRATRAFGVPTIRVDGGRGPGMFGPVISEMPDDDETVAMFEHVVWLIANDNIAELKRDRARSLDVERSRQWDRERAARRRARARAERRGRD
jgi:hypothetical protein